MKGREQMPLNDLRCKNAKPKSRPYKLSDMEGLYLFVNVNGRKNWRFKYRYLGKEKILSLGLFPETSLKDARRKKNLAKDELENGNDPALLRAEAKAKQKQEKEISENDALDYFEPLARKWYLKFINNWDEENARRVLRRLEDELFPDLGSLLVREITPQILLNCIQKASIRNADLGRRLLGYSKRVFNYGGLLGKLDKDPTMGVKENLEKCISGNFARIEIEELPEFLDALFSETPVQNIIGNYATRLIILFGTRTKELLHAETKEFIRDKQLWIINSDRIKKPREQAKIKRDHLVPISKQAEKLLQELDEIFGKDRKFLFPSPRKSEKPICKHAILKELDRIGYKGAMTGHGARSLMMDVGTECIEKQEHYVIDRQLGHVPKSEVMRRYNRAKYLPQRTKFMQVYADKLEEILINHQTSKGKNDRNNCPTRTNAKSYSINGYERGAIGTQN